MKDKGLNYTKKKLTVIFTFLVFWIAVLLEWVFFTYKYYNYIDDEEQSFNILTENIENKFISLNTFIISYDWNRLFKMRELTNPDAKKKAEKNFLNLLIIDKDKNELIFSNVVDYLKVNFVENILKEFKYWEIKQEGWYLIKKIKIIDDDKNYDMIFIKNLRYSFLDYLRDLLGFAWIMSIFSAFFFYVWYKFVSKNLEPVEENLTDMQNFIHNVWHELKTPISIVYSNLQLIKEIKTFDLELINEWLNEINRLDNLIESLIELSSICWNNNVEKFELSNEIESIIKDFKSDSDKKSINVVFKKIREKSLTINKQYFYILFSNLLWNAIKYTNEKWNIDIVLYGNRLLIKDNWIWISGLDKDKIFDRFFMWEKSRNQVWYGIWLSLVKKIANIYKWKIIVKSELWKGSEFTIVF